MPNSYFLLVVLLCLSLHACNARPLGDALEKKFHTSNKKDEKKDLDTVPVALKANSSLSNELVTMKAESKDTKDAKMKTSNYEMGKTTGAAETDESPNSVSWRVPHDQRPEKNPGFNSDYSPPKTHPPSHN